MFVEILTLLALYLAVYIASTIWQNRHLPPGPFPFPVLGNLLSISQDQPYRDFANMAKKYGKLFRIQMGSKKAVVINSYEIAREALLTKAKDFAGRPPHFLGSIFGRNGSAIGFESFSERWKMQHKMLTAALRSTEDKANISLHIEELCGLFLSSHAEPFCPRDNVYKSFGNCLSSMIFGQECKLDDREVDTLIDAVHVFRMSLGAANAIDTFPFLKYIPFEIIKRARRAGENRDEIFNRRFRQHVSTFKKGNIRSTIDAMLKDFWSDGCNLLTEEKLISSASELFIAGTGTLSVVIIWSLYYVTKHPDVQARLHCELDEFIGKNARLPEFSDRPNLPYFEAFTAELHRSASDNPLALPHSTTRDTSLAGFFIPRDITVFVNLWGIHHDPDYWREPFSFRPDRFLDEQRRLHVEGIMPFSTGTRSCLGEKFAKRVVFLFIARLLHRFRFECPHGEILPEEEDISDYGILLDCKPFRIKAIERRVNS